MTLIARLTRGAGTPSSGLLTGDDPDRDTGPGTPAAVLIPIVDRPKPGLLLTVRTSTLRHHAGQIAFPGGRIEAGESAEQAALREAHEEVGLDPALVRVLGVADPYRTVTGFAVTPVIGLIPPDLALVPSDGEVAELFEVPLAFVIDPANHAQRTLQWEGRQRTYWEIAWQERRIWGVTAGIIVNLSRRMEPVS